LICLYLQNKNDSGRTENAYHNSIYHTIFLNSFVKNILLFSIDVFYSSIRRIKNIKPSKVYESVAITPSALCTRLSIGAHSENITSKLTSRDTSITWVDITSR